MKRWLKWNLPPGIVIGSLVGLILTFPITMGGCGTLDFPTKTDVNRLTEAEREFVKALHDAGNKLMTEQHSAMTPELAEAFAVMTGQYQEISAALKAKASKTEAEGIDVGLGSFGGMNDWLTALIGLISGGSLWSVIGNLFKPSRATARIDALEKSTTERISSLEKDLATAAKAGASIPSDIGKN